MAMRAANEQKMHDTIVRSLKHIYLEQRNASRFATELDGDDTTIKGVTVDMIVKNPFVITFKIETESTVNEGEAIAWKSISEKAGVFYLMVPEPLRAEAVRIIRKNEIKGVRMCAYKVVENRLKFIGIP